MIGRVLFSLSALALIAAKPAAVEAPPRPMLSVVAPAEVANDPSNRLTIELSTGGRVVILLRPDAAPAHVERMKTLVRNGFYNGLAFHRVVPGFMAQGGDPKGTGEGGSTLPDLKAEFNTLPFMRGMLGAARAESADSANSQFFIMLGPNSSLNDKYTVYGRVIEGMDAVDKIAPGEPPENPTKIVRMSLGG
ncbi:MAG TPA: peptidylprolyl isomerase [Sphingomicrobium sp.]|jgi:cyclophilin family peptidyl-prolyl cis-trans isomerase|nr:peptidylprolyl isomerase [Sphingomicrobium sp.]